MSETTTPSQPLDSSEELRAFVERIDERVQRYLGPRADGVEQRDHLRHVADRTRWLYYSELQRDNPGVSVIISAHEDSLIDACVYSHDIGKWIPRDELKALLPEGLTPQAPVFQQLRLTLNQIDLFALGVGRRLELEIDGYTPEYDSAHHLVSAYILVADPTLGFDQLDPADQERLMNMIVGHQFGSYFKESLLNLSMDDASVTTGMLVDVSRLERVVGDLLASSFHDADISDLLFVGSLERRPNREEIFHTGGLIKILMINFLNLIYGAPHGPTNLTECLRSCQGTVNNACKEFLTATASRHGNRWRKEARRFLGLFKEKTASEKIEAALHDESLPPAERLSAVRMVTYMHARSFLKGQGREEEA
jgi:hypothetical protein